MSGVFEVVMAPAPVSERVRAYFAPVTRTQVGVAPVPAVFDPASSGRFAAGQPPVPWMDLGWVSRFVRVTGTKLEALRSGAPAATKMQVRTELEATVSVDFESWGKLQLAVCSGSQQMNLLVSAAGAAASGSGGVAQAAVALQTGSTARTLNVGATAAAGFAVGQMVSVDVDYTGQTGFVGSGVAGGYVKSAGAVGNDVGYIRRVSLNVGVIAAIDAGVLTLAAPLLAGVPGAGMRVSAVAGFVDREGGSFFQEWSALFCVDGVQGDRVLYHYPRLQAMHGSSEMVEPLRKGVGLMRSRLTGAFRALPVIDGNDGEPVLCYRSYLGAILG